VRAVISGAGHDVQQTGEPFNDALVAFVEAAHPRAQAPASS
jgi:hypothetical protein